VLRRVVYSRREGNNSLAVVMKWRKKSLLNSFPCWH